MVTPLAFPSIDPVGSPTDTTAMRFTMGSKEFSPVLVQVLLSRCGSGEPAGVAGGLRPDARDGGGDKGAVHRVSPVIVL